MADVRAEELIAEIAAALSAGTPEYRRRAAEALLADHPPSPAMAEVWTDPALRRVREELAAYARSLDE